MRKMIDRVAVIGAGTMGVSIAAPVLNADIDVFLLGIEPQELAPEGAKTWPSNTQRCGTALSPKIGNAA